jgi:hypothetical protein
VLPLSTVGGEVSLSNTRGTGSHCSSDSQPRRSFGIVAATLSRTTIASPWINLPDGLCGRNTVSWGERHETPSRSGAAMGYTRADGSSIIARSLNTLKGNAVKHFPQRHLGVMEVGEPRQSSGEHSRCRNSGEFRYRKSFTALAVPVDDAIDSYVAPAGAHQSAFPPTRGRSGADGSAARVNSFVVAPPTRRRWRRSK